MKRAAKKTFHSLWMLSGLGLDLYTNKKTEKAMVWGWERSIVLLLLYLLYRMTLEIFLSHSHHVLFVQLAQVALLVAFFCWIGKLLHSLWKMPPTNLLSNVGETTHWRLSVLICMLGLTCPCLVMWKFILCYLTRLLFDNTV